MQVYAKTQKDDNMVNSTLLGMESQKGVDLCGRSKAFKEMTFKRRHYYIYICENSTLIG